MGEELLFTVPDLTATPPRQSRPPGPTANMRARRMQQTLAKSEGHSYVTTHAHLPTTAVDPSFSGLVRVLLGRRAD